MSRTPCSASDTEHAEPIHRIGVQALRELAATGAFGRGSMGPKVGAACRFVADTGGTAVITSLSKLAAAVAGQAGTVVVPDPDLASTNKGETVA